MREVDDGERLLENMWNIYIRDIHVATQHIQTERQKSGRVF